MRGVRYNMFTLELDELERLALLEVLKSSLDNTNELLENHDEALGRTTYKNTLIAREYEQEVEVLKVFIDKVEECDGMC